RVGEIGGGHAPGGRHLGHAAAPTRRGVPVRTQVPVEHAQLVRLAQGRGAGRHRILLVRPTRAAAQQLVEAPEQAELALARHDEVARRVDEGARVVALQEEHDPGLPATSDTGTLLSVGQPADMPDSPSRSSADPAGWPIVGPTVPKEQPCPCASTRLRVGRCPRDSDPTPRGSPTPRGPRPRRGGSTGSTPPSRAAPTAPPLLPHHRPPTPLPPRPVPTRTRAPSRSRWSTRHPPDPPPWRPQGSPARPARRRSRPPVRRRGRPPSRSPGPPPAPPPSRRAPPQRAPPTRGAPP